jgi:ComF family protein
MGEAAMGLTLIVPVPLHPKRLRWRGFNQSLLLAHALRDTWRQSGLPVPPILATGLARIRETQPQMELTGVERRVNVAGAFTVPGHAQHRIRGARVLLVDDVATTGATLRECAAALLAAGAERVDAMAVARV